jgi:hypothetical protein
MNFRELTSLPVYGEMATNFETNGEQGFVVEFFPEDSKLNWTGNFRLGINPFCKVIEHPNGKDVLVISGGDILVVNPYTKTLVEEMSSMINSVQELPNQELLCASDVDIVLINHNGLKWKSTRLSPDGLKLTELKAA